MCVGGVNVARQMQMQPLHVQQPGAAPLHVQQPGAAPSSSPRSTRAEVVTEENVQTLKDMFPAIEKDVIQSVLEASSGHVDVAINNLLSMNG